MIDLHMHTTLSTDGHDEPEAFVERAAARGLTAMAVTEHSNIDSLPRAKRRALALGIEYINGMETGGALPLDREPRNIDVLGYFFDDDAPAIRAFCERIKQRERLRTDAFLSGLQSLEIPIARDQVAALYPGRVSGWAVRRMLRADGYAKDKPESSRIEQNAVCAAIAAEPRRYEGLNQPGTSAAEAIDAIHADGGMAMMAHPFWLTKPARGGHPPEVVWRQIACFLDIGGDGLEAVNHGNDAGCADIVLDYCRRNNLPASGGTDTHRSEGVGAICVSFELLQSMQRYRRGESPW